MNRFFTKDDFTSSSNHLSLIPQCGLCGLFRHCSSPKMKPTGEGRRKILILGEAAGRNEDEQGKQFVGDSGKLLERTLAKYGIDFRKDCWITNAVICRPHTADGKNRAPSDKEMEWCRPTMIETVTRLKPEIIIPLGATAVKSLIGWVWKAKEVGAISRWDGWQIPCQKLNCWICPTWHPAYILRTNYGSQKENDVRTLFFESHLEAASKLEGRPWKEVPDYRKQVSVILDHEEAAERIVELTKRGVLTAWSWDLETDMLKPDSEDAGIHSCSLSDGETAFAFPWHGAAVKAMRYFLKSEVPKIGANIKFEQRWIRAKLGMAVRHWVWDTTLAAHALDNRPKVSSVKFQAFVLLGQDAYDEEIKPFLKARSPNEKNRIHKCDLRKVLLYCGMDSLVEHKIATIQAERIGVPLR